MGLEGLGFARVVVERGKRQENRTHQASSHGHVFRAGEGNREDGHFLKSSRLVRISFTVVIAVLYLGGYVILFRTVERWVTRAEEEED